MSLTGVRKYCVMQVMGTVHKPILPVLLVLITLSAGSCGSAAQPAERRYDLSGQVVAVDPSRSEVTIEHDAIAGYMDAMVMPFKVPDADLLATLGPGDLVRGRLVVRPDDGLLESLERTGHRDVPAKPPAALLTTGDFLIEGDSVPNVGFVDQDGRRRSLRPQRDAALVITFIYTRCPFPTFCPMMDRHFTALQQRITTEPKLKDRVQLLSVTVDPAHDTPAVLKAHAAQLGADERVWTFVTPEGPDATAFAQRIGVTATRQSSDSAVIVHNLVTAVVDPSGVIAKIYRGNQWTPVHIATLLTSLLNSRESKE
jgi:protein SCO1